MCGIFWQEYLKWVREMELMKTKRTFIPQYRWNTCEGKERERKIV
jgi:hypothetical protein